MLLLIFLMIFFSFLMHFASLLLYAIDYASMPPFLHADCHLPLSFFDLIFSLIDAELLIISRLLLFDWGWYISSSAFAALRCHFSFHDVYWLIFDDTDASAAIFASFSMIRCFRAASYRCCWFSLCWCWYANIFCCFLIFMFSFFDFFRWWLISRLIDIGRFSFFISCFYACCWLLSFRCFSRHDDWCFTIYLLLTLFSSIFSPYALLRRHTLAMLFAPLRWCWYHFISLLYADYADAWCWWLLLSLLLLLPPDARLYLWFSLDCNNISYGFHW